MKKEWTIEQCGQIHSVIYISKKETGEDELYVDGIKVKIEKESYVKFVGFDQTFTIEDQTYHFVVNGNIIDIAVEGRYIGSKERYMPLKQLAMFGIFAILILLTSFLVVIFDPPLYVGIFLWMIFTVVYIWGRKAGLPGFYTKKE